MCGDMKVIIWNAVPFDNQLDFSEYQLGEVIRVMEDTDKFIIKLNDGSLLVNEYECDTKIKQGVILQ